MSERWLRAQLRTVTNQNFSCFHVCFYGFADRDESEGGREAEEAPALGFACELARLGNGTYNLAAPPARNKSRTVTNPREVVKPRKPQLSASPANSPDSATAPTTSPHLLPARNRRPGVSAHCEERAIASRSDGWLGGGCYSKGLKMDQHPPTQIGVMHHWSASVARHWGDAIVLLSLIHI